jgi:hypothetical protein
MANIEAEQIRAFLQALGDRYTQSANLFLLGGSALCLLGSPRSTLDIDYVGDDVNPDDLQCAIAQLANEMHIEAEPVPIAQFLPLPADVEERCIFVERFGVLNVYVFDPYIIALSKLDRGFDTDVDDVVFLIRHSLVHLEQLQAMVQVTLEHASEFDLNPTAMRAHLQVVQKQV